MTIPFALLKAQNGMKLFCSPWALFLSYNRFEEQIHYRARGGECATFSADRIIMCADRHFKHK